MRTWVYRVAHNVAASHVSRERRRNAGQVTLDAIEEMPGQHDLGAESEANDALSRLHAIIRTLGPPDRQIITLYLEELDASAIADITGLSPGVIATRISRLKSQIARHFHETANV